MRSIIFIALSLLVMFGARADAAPDYLNLGGVSYHYNTHGRVHGLREVNQGIGLTWADLDAPILGIVDASIGGYANSDYRTTVYAAVHKLPFDVIGGKAGITLALATGYRWDLTPIPSPTICWRYACVMATPPFKDQSAGVVSLQFRTPL
jgi:hypothetical protein